MKIIALIGMMGGGKSAVGRRLAARLDAPFADTDALVEEAAQMSVAEIFARFGEADFRRREGAALAEGLARLAGGGVLATGGGVVLGAENRRRLREETTCFYLAAAPDLLAARLREQAEEGAKRPLLGADAANPRARLAALLAERAPLYRQTAHFVIRQTRDDAPDDVAGRVLAAGVGGR